MDATTVVDRVVIPAGATKADVQSLYEVLASVPDGCKRLGSHRLAQGKQAQSTPERYDLETRHVVAQRDTRRKSSRGDRRCSHSL
jgi:hypothetical protein